MKTAEEVANNWMNHPDNIASLAEEITAYADERVKEAQQEIAYIKETRAEAFKEAARIALAHACSCETCPAQISRKLRVLGGQKE